MKSRWQQRQIISKSDISSIVIQGMQRWGKKKKKKNMCVMYTSCKNTRIQLQTASTAKRNLKQKL